MKVPAPRQNGRAMRLRDLDGWPPPLTDSYSSKKSLEPQAPATLKRCLIFSAIGGPPAYLSIVVSYQGQDWHAMITDKPESMLRRIEATLRGHQGQTLASLADLEIQESA